MTRTPIYDALCRETGVQPLSPVRLARQLLADYEEQRAQLPAFIVVDPATEARLLRDPTLLDRQPYFRDRSHALSSLFHGVPVIVARHPKPMFSDSALVIRDTA